MSALGRAGARWPVPLVDVSAETSELDSELESELDSGFGGV